MNKPMSAEEFAANAKVAISKYKAEIDELKKQLSVAKAAPKKGSAITPEIIGRLADADNAEQALAAVCTIVKVNPADIEVSDLSQYVTKYIDNVVTPLKQNNASLVAKNKELVTENEELVTKNEELVTENKELVANNVGLEARVEELEEATHVPVISKSLFKKK